ncbi:MAG: DUF4097 family beta strand repeat-containing protein [Proteobacteria bacterium]|nr:DUF4097 family beta strand repeat-containing protein [Pseudomonadota bacterium]
MMKMIKVILFCFAATATFAAERVDRTLDAAANGDVRIENVSGSVEVRGWSKNQVEVTGELGSGVEELIFERDGDDVIIKVRLPRRSSRSGDADLEISVPVGSSLQVNTVSADIDIEDVRGEQRLESVSGDIATTVFGSEVEAESVSGDIEVKGDNQVANASFHSVSGDIVVENLSGDLRAETVNGEINVINGSFKRISGDTVNGEILFRVGLQNEGRMDIETINGAVDVEFDGEVSARFDIETFNGAIRNCFGPESVRTSKYSPGRELSFAEGGGSGRVTISTLNGSVTICK